MPANRVQECISKIAKQVENLGEMNVPVVLTLLHKGKVDIIGSKNTRKFLQSIPEVRVELEKDALALCKGETDVIDPVTNPNEANKELELPAPIELLNTKDTITVLRDLIVYDHRTVDREQNAREKMSDRWIRYGDRSWQPSFWPNQLWHWSKMINFNKIKVKHLEEQGLRSKFETLAEFFKHVIRMGFDQLDLNPDDFLADTFDAKEEKKRKKARHIKTVPAVSRSPQLEEPAESNESSRDPEDLPTSEEDFVGQPYEYRSPVPVAAGRVADNTTYRHRIDQIIEPSNCEPEHPNYDQNLEPSFLTAETDEIPFPPSLMHHVWENCIIRRNERGASSISRAAVQSIGLSEATYWKLKVEIHKNIIANFAHFRNQFKFPLELKNENGGLDSFENETDLLRYLGSAMSLSVFNKPLVELLALGNILGGTVYVLHQERRADGASGWKWETHPPIAPDKENKYYTGKNLCLITGNYLHFFLITVSNATLPRTAPETENVSQDEEIIREAEETVETERFAMVPISNLKKAVETNQPGSELRRSTRVSKQTEKYKSFTQKKRNAEPDLKSRDGKKAKKVPNSSMDWDSAAAEIDEHLRSKKARHDELREMGAELRNALTIDNIREIFHDNLEYFKNIFYGKEKTWRSSWYKAGKDETVLMGKMIALPFSDEQQEAIFQEVRKVFLSQEVLLSRFVDLVLMSEIHIRIYQVFFQLSRSEAEKNLTEQYIYYESSSTSSNGNGMLL